MITKFLFATSRDPSDLSKADHKSPTPSDRGVPANFGAVAIGQLWILEALTKLIIHCFKCFQFSVSLKICDVLMEISAYFIKFDHHDFNLYQLYTV